MSWIVVHKKTGKAVAEIFNKATLKNLNTKVYKALEAGDYLGKLNKSIRSNPHKAGSADKVAARELQLFIDNERDLYRQRTVPIMKNLEAKFKKGKYSETKAAKLWEYLATEGAKRYAKEYGGEGLKIFSPATRRLTARLMARYHLTEMKLGNFQV